MKEVNKRFILLMYEIILSGKGGCTNIVTFCAKMKINRQRISYIKSGTSDVTAEEILKMYKHFKASPTYLYTSKGEKFI